VVRNPFSAATELKLFPLENDAIVQTQPVAFLADSGVESFVEKGGGERTNNRKYLIVIVVDLSGLVLSQVTARSLVISETRVQHHMTSSKILSNESGGGSGFPRAYHQSTTAPHSPVTAPRDRDTPDQAAHCHTLGPRLGAWFLTRHWSEGSSFFSFSVFCFQM
jgi:hypothetical protein